MTVTVKDFHAEWCGPCDQQEPILDELNADRDDIELQKFDVEEHQDEANQYQVRSLPTIVVVDENENVLDRFVGLTQRNEIEAVVDSA